VLKREMQEAVAATALAEEAEAAAAIALAQLEKEQADLDNARRVLKKAEVVTINARAAVMAAENAMSNPVLTRCNRHHLHFDTKQCRIAPVVFDISTGNCGSALLC
jgi:hypothetical protein